MSLYNTEKSENSQLPQGVFHFWKQPGETLAIMLRRFREEQGYGEDEKITYAGRLDPMAEGIVPLLVGEARFQKDRLMSTAKTYEVDILLGLGTDTADMLGVVTANTLEQHRFERVTEEAINTAINTLSELTELTYPKYSSRPVDGKPLFMHARAGNAVSLPIKKVTIHAMELLGIKEVPLSQVLDSAIEIIKTVYGDFRQEEILEQWESIKKQTGETVVQIVSIRTTVSSGTYMRSLAEKMGELLAVPALAYRIVRTEVQGK